MNIDVNYKEVTRQILNKCFNKPKVDLEKKNLSVFNRPSLGKDLYKINAEESTQIAMAASSLNINLSPNAITSLNYLKANATVDPLTISTGGKLDLCA